MTGLIRSLAGRNPSRFMTHLVMLEAADEGKSAMCGDDSDKEYGAVDRQRLAEQPELATKDGAFMEPRGCEVPSLRGRGSIFSLNAKSCEPEGPTGLDSANLTGAVFAAKMSSARQPHGFETLSSRCVVVDRRVRRRGRGIRVRRW
jgi:hypothetical protein